MKRLMVVAAMVLMGASGAFAADQTWRGKISDSKCGATHAAGEHGTKMTDLIAEPSIKEFDVRVLIRLA